MFSVAINDIKIEPLSEIPKDPIGISIVHINPQQIVGIPAVISHDEAVQLADWLYDLCMATTDDVIMFNGTFIEKKDIKKCTTFRKVYVRQG